MRAIFSVLGLLIVVAIVGVLVKNQLGAGVAPAAPAAAGRTSPSGAPALTGTPQQQMEQFKNAAEGALQQARPMPEEPK